MGATRNSTLKCSFDSEVLNILQKASCRGNLMKKMVALWMVGNSNSVSSRKKSTAHSKVNQKFTQEATFTSPSSRLIWTNGKQKGILIVSNGLILEISLDSVIDCYRVQIQDLGGSRLGWSSTARQSRNKSQCFEFEPIFRTTLGLIN